MLREYEFTLITRGDLSEADQQKVVGDYEKLMTGEAGEILKKDEWGVKKLAYPIKKTYRGHYVTYNYVGEPSNLSEMERLMRIDENVLRYLAVNVSGDRKVNVEERRAELSKPPPERSRSHRD
jgi:small subunit ribosomal protein S6